MAAPYGVVIVPGIGGSQLSYRGGKGGKTVLWFNPSALVQNTPLALALDTDGTSPYPLVGKNCFADGPVALGYYEPLITQMANDGLNPVFWSYDWRLSLDLLASQFALYLSIQNLAKPFYVVAHSMGGLVARLAYPLWKAMNTGQQWGTTAYLGTPHGGSYWASATLAGLYAEGSFFKALANTLDIAAAINPVAAAAITVSRAAAGTMVGSWPALYCLLPSNQGIWAGLDANAGNLLKIATYAHNPPGQQAQWFTLANTVLGELKDPNGEQAPAARFNVIGQQPSTLYRFKVNGNPGDLLAYPTTGDGDGTVPTERASWQGVPTMTFKRTSHTALTNTLGPLTRLLDWLQTPPTADASFNNDAAVKSNPGGSTIPYVPLKPVTFLITTGDP